MLHISEVLERSAHNGEYPTIAIDGPGGSGKSEVGRWLKKLLPNFVLLEGDDYFEPLTDLPPGMRGGFNVERFMLDVGHSLQRGGRALSYRPYSWRIQGPTYDGPTHVPSGGGCDCGRY